MKKILNEWRNYVNETEAAEKKAALRSSRRLKARSSRLTKTIVLDKITNKVFKQLKEKKGRVTKSQLGQLIKEEIKTSIEEGFFSRIGSKLGVESSATAKALNHYEKSQEGLQAALRDAVSVGMASYDGDTLSREQEKDWRKIQLEYSYWDAARVKASEAFHKHGANEKQKRQMQRIQRYGESADVGLDEKFEEAKEKYESKMTEHEAAVAKQKAQRESEKYWQDRKAAKEDEAARKSRKRQKERGEIVYSPEAIAGRKKEKEDWARHMRDRRTRSHDYDDDSYDHD